MMTAGDDGKEGSGQECHNELEVILRASLAENRRPL